MGNRSHRRFRKFYEDQVKQVLGLIEKQFSKGQIPLDTYLDICEQKGIEPDPDEMPPTMGDYPLEVQVAFLLHDLLPDRWEGMSGTFMGKDYSIIFDLFVAHEVLNKPEQRLMLKIMSTIDKIRSDIIVKKQKERENKKPSS